MDSSKIQALFLVDCASSSQDTATRDVQWRNICLSCVRTLLYLTKFPNREHIKTVQWNCRLYSSQTQVLSQLRTSSTYFQNVTSDNLETFFTDLRKCINQFTSQPLTSIPPAQLLYNALAASVQDYPWDAPEIVSPVRPISSRSRPHRRTQSANLPVQRKNFIFVFATCPESEGELGDYCRVSEIRPLKETVRSRLFPAPLLAKLEEKGISVHWIHLTSSGLPSIEASPVLSSMSELLALTGGTLLPSTALVGPVHLPISSSASETGPSSEVMDSTFQKLITPTDDLKKTTKIGSTTNKTSPSKGNEEACSVVQSHIAGVIPSLFPSSSFLEKYLKGQRSEDKNMLHALNADKNVYSFTTTAGKLLCVLELRKMYNSRTEQLPQSTSHHHTSFSSLSSEQKLHPPTSALPSEKRRRSIKKKLSFSQASKEGSTKWQSPSNAEKQNISRPNMDADFGTLDTVSCKNIPQVVMVGVVKQMDLPLSFLCPTSSCSCSSICVPRSVRTQYSLPVLTVATPSLFKLPFTPPSQLSKRKKHWGLRKRSKSAPLVSSGVDVCSLMNLSLTVDVKRCVSIKDKPGSHSPPQRSVSMSPRYPVLRLKDVLEAQKITKSLPQPQIPHPNDCLADRQFHSRQFQTLCMWLAKKGYHLVVQVCTGSGASSVAILQPVTSLLATLTLVRPRHQTTLLSKLVQLRGDSKANSSPCASSVASSERSKFAMTGDSSRSKVTEGVEINTWRSKVASDVELMTTVSLLFSANPTKSDLIFPQDNARDFPFFTNQFLLPWVPCSEHSGLSKTAFNTLSNLQSDCSGDGGSHARLGVVSKLKDAYCSRDSAVGGVHSLCLHSVGSERRGEETGDHTNVVDEAPQSVATKETEESVLSVASLEELHSWFQESYQEQVEVALDQEKKGDCLQRWASSIIPKFAKSFKTLVANGDLLTNQIEMQDIQSRLWDELNSSVLVSGSSLGGKYDSLFKNLQQSGGSKELENDSKGSKDEVEGINGDVKEREEALFSQRLSEYLLQVFIRFEVLKACPGLCQDQEAYSDQLIFLLRKISLMSNPSQLGRLMKKIVLPLYLNICKPVLMEIYEGLMLPLPSDLDPDPESEMESVGVASQTEETASSEDEYSMLSMEEPLHAPKLPLLNTRKLARHTSFQETAAQRQITVVSKKKNGKKSRKPDAKKRLKANGPLSVQSSPLQLSKTSMDSQSGKNRRGACRNLFTRSQSMCESVVSLKRRLSDDGDQGQHAKKKKTSGLHRHSTMAAHVLVKETPVKKQVENYQKFKLQRLRSKTVITSPDVIAIEESPKRSFYSRPRITRVPDPEPALFKTPPLKDHKKKTSPNQLLLKKEPSPAALHSLLHGEILSPTTSALQSSPIQDTPHSRTLISESPLKRVNVAVVDKSPELFGEVSELQAGLSSLDNCVVIGRTPSKGVGLSAPKDIPGASGNSLRAPSVKTNMRTARMLTYDSGNTSQELSTDPPESILNDTGNGLTSVQSVQSLLTCVDPGIENESASMMAFALCTPTKEDRRDFHKAFVD